MTKNKLIGKSGLPNSQRAISFRQNLDDCIAILMSAGKWRTEHKITYSPIWDPKKISKQSYLDEFYDYQAYVLYLSGIPTATATLADPAEAKLSTWKETLGDAYEDKKSLYVDDLAVIGDKIGQGIIGILFEEIEKYARSHSYNSLRLDVDARLSKLTQCYAKHGFKEVMRKDVGSRVSVFMQKELRQPEEEVITKITSRVEASSRQPSSSKLELVEPTNPVLNRAVGTVKPSEISSPAVQGVIDRMLELSAGKGHSKADTRQMVGLAAPQLGVNKRIITIDLTADGSNKTQTLQPIINPQITSHSKSTIEGREGCWSCGNICGIVDRAKEVTIEGFDRKGKPVKLELEGFVARIAQHEVDHLNGIRFPDRIPVDKPERLHLVKPIEFDDYRSNWMHWQTLCPRTRWELMKAGTLQNFLATHQPKVGNTLFVAVDGHGGSGKTTLAALLMKKLGAQLIQTDDFASWDNPYNWWPLVIETVFDPIKAGAKTLSHPRSKWWENHQPEPVVNQPVTKIMILEGVSALRKEFRDYISVGIYVDTPREVCLKRGIERDINNDTGKTEAEIIAMWEKWADDEDKYLAHDKPQDYADIVIDGTRPFEDQIN